MQAGEDLQMDKEAVLKECFQLVRVLGEGSFGKVYLIRNKETRKQYALKRYYRNRIEKQGKYRMLVRSIFILQALRHRAIIRFVNYIISPDDSTIYLLFQPCKKGNLDRLRRALDKQPSPVRTRIIKYILYELAIVLGYLKASNVAHRDLKPSNITFNNEGQLKLIDFDQAVCFDPQFSKLSQKMLADFGINVTQVMGMFNSQKSRASSYVGTQIYMSPEMIHSTICDEKGDLWAYGCIFYELFLGQYLHIEFDTAEKFEEQLKLRMEALSQRVDKETVALFSAIANFNPKDRIDIVKVPSHPFFDDIRDPKAMQQCRLSLVSVLRGNHGIIARTTLDNCEIQIIGMHIGKQTFQLLRTVILLKKTKGYDFMNIYGGPQYFKVQSVNESKNQFYIRYDKIKSVKLQGEHVNIIVAVQQEEEIIQLKHIYPEMLTNLYNLINLIYND